MKKLFNTITLLLLFPALILAGNNEPGKYTKQKNIKKAYLVNPDAGIDIQNSYGSIYVTTWEEDKVDIDVLVKISGDDEDWVNKRLNEIDIEFTGLKNLVSAKTVISGSGKGSRNNSIEINYTIKIPKKGGVKLNNKYGNITTTDLLAGVNISCKYGKITMAKLLAGNSIIDIDYCGGSTIEYIKSGTVHADYSKLTLNDFGTINIDADYTEIAAVEGDNLKYECNYGKLTLGRINDLTGNGDYMGIKADQLTGDLKVNTKYSKITVADISSNANDITINSQYTSVNINYNPGYAFDFDVNVKYANFNHESDVKIDSKQEGSFSKNYQGHYKKEGSNKVTIRSEYGNVKLSKS